MGGLGAGGGAGGVPKEELVNRGGDVKHAKKGKKMMKHREK